MKKDMAVKEAELKRKEARPVIEIVNDALLNSEAVQEKMSAYSKDEACVIAKHIVENIDTIISESEDKINELRAKKKEHAEKRKAAKLDRELEKMVVVLFVMGCELRVSRMRTKHEGVKGKRSFPCK